MCVEGKLIFCDIPRYKYIDRANNSFIRCMDYEKPTSNNFVNNFMVRTELTLNN